MRIGKTIGGKRERAETESERLLHREKVKRRKLISVATYLAVLMLLVLGAVVAIKGANQQEVDDGDGDSSGKVEPTVEIVDEAGVGVPGKAREFVGYLEQDLAEVGVRLLKAVLPRDKTREVDVYVADFEGYFKLSLDRGAGVSAEDLERMLRYFRGIGVSGAEYVDLRVEGKGYYKGAIEGGTAGATSEASEASEVSEAGAVGETGELAEGETGGETEVGTVEETEAGTEAEAAEEGITEVEEVYGAEEGGGE